MSHYDYTFFMAAECLKHPYRLIGVLPLFLTAYAFLHGKH